MSGPKPLKGAHPKIVIDQQTAEAVATYVTDTFNDFCDQASSFISDVQGNLAIAGYKGREWVDMAQRFAAHTGDILKTYSEYQNTLNFLKPQDTTCLINPQESLAYYNDGTSFLDGWLGIQLSGLLYRNSWDVPSPPVWNNTLKYLQSSQTRYPHWLCHDGHESDIGAPSNVNIVSQSGLFPDKANKTPDDQVVWTITYDPIRHVNDPAARTSWTRWLAYSQFALHQFDTLDTQKINPIRGGLAPVNFATVIKVIDQEFKAKPYGTLHYTELELKGALPTPVEPDGLPAIVYAPLNPPDAKIFWDSTAGVYYVELPEGSTTQTIELDIYNRQDIEFTNPLKPFSFSVAGTPSPAQPSDLSPGTRAIFEEALAYGDVSQYADHALTREQQLIYAADQMAHQWKRYVSISSPEGHYEIFKNNTPAVLKNMHTPGGLNHANCQVANAEFYLAARAYGFNVGFSSGFMNADLSKEDIHTVFFTTPPHAWVTYIDPQTHIITLLDTTPPDGNPSGKWYQVRAKIEDIKKQGKLYQMEARQNGHYQKLAGALQTGDQNLIFNLLGQIGKQADQLPAESIKELPQKISTNQNYVFEVIDQNKNATYRLEKNSTNIDKVTVLVFERNPLMPFEKGESLGYFEMKLISDTFDDDFAELIDSFQNLKELHEYVDTQEPGEHGLKAMTILDWQVKTPPSLQKYVAEIPSNEKADDSFHQMRTMNNELTGSKMMTINGVEKKLPIHGEKYKPHLNVMVLDQNNEIVSVEDLTQLVFESIVDEKTRSILYFNSSRGILINDLSYIYMEDPQTKLHYSFRWISGENGRKTLAAIENPFRSEVLELWNDKDEFVSVSINRALTIAHAFFVAVKGTEVDNSPTQLKLFYETYQRILEHPPIFIEEDGFKTGHINDVAVLAFIILEAKRLNIEQADDRSVFSGRKIEAMCEDTNHDPLSVKIYKPCTKFVTASTTLITLEKQLRAKMATPEFIKSLQIAQSSGHLKPMYQKWLYEFMRQK